MQSLSSLLWKFLFRPCLPFLVLHVFWLLCPIITSQTHEDFFFSLSLVYHLPRANTGISLYFPVKLHIVNTGDFFMPLNTFIGLHGGFHFMPLTTFIGLTQGISLYTPVYHQWFNTVLYTPVYHHWFNTVLYTPGLTQWSHFTLLSTISRLTWGITLYNPAYHLWFNKVDHTLRPCLPSLG